MPGLGVIGHAHFLHRAWRYRTISERSELAAVLRADLRGATALDIGAHRGIYSYWLSKAVGPSGRVIAFEPQPDMIRQFKDFQDSFFWRKNITMVESGPSDHPGRATLRRVGGHTGGASIVANDRPDAEAFEIPLTTLDEHFAANPPPSRIAFIKCDVEGHERAVFRGGARTIAEHRSAILFECHDDHAALPPADGVFADLAALGYRGWFLHNGRRTPIEQLPQRRAAIDRPYLNYLFEHARP